jgi:hypothetical protein
VLGPLDYVLWFATAILQAAAVVCALRAKCFLKFFLLNFYLLAACLATAARYFVFAHYGYLSVQYSYFYFYSDFLLTICLYLALTGLFAHVFREMGASKLVRFGVVMVLVMTAVVTFVIQQHTQGMFVHHRVRSRFVTELSRDLYFIGALFTYLLWAAVLKLRQMHTRVIQIVLALGVYFSAYAASYSLYGIDPPNLLWRGICYITALWLPIAWGYAFLKVPAEARLATAQIATGHQ